MEAIKHYGQYGGCYVSELLISVLERVEKAYLKAKDDPEFRAELKNLLTEFAGRPTPLTHAKKLSDKWGFILLLKREDLLHGGAHKTNNVLGQGLLAKRMQAKELIAETGAGQHGVATAMAGALFGLPTKIFMGAKDIKRQQPNVQRMKLFGAEVISVKSGSQTLKDAINDTMRYWVAHTQEAYYVFGTAAGPHPFPSMVADFTRVIGEETRRQCLEKFGRLPHTVCACVGGGSNAIGIFQAFLNDKEVRLVGVEPAGKGLNTSQHGAPLNKGRVGCLHGSISYCLQDNDGQIQEAHSISAGVDYPGVGPWHSYLKDTGRATYGAATDDEAVEAFQFLTKEEGIIPALESSHALAWVKKMSGFDQSSPRLRLANRAQHDKILKKDDIVIVNLSGRGDKDLAHVQHYLEVKNG